MRAFVEIMGVEGVPRSFLGKRWALRLAAVVHLHIFLHFERDKAVHLHIFLHFERDKAHTLG